jgi:hypothetical protein
LSKLDETMLSSITSRLESWNSSSESRNHRDLERLWVMLFVLLHLDGRLPSRSSCRRLNKCLIGFSRAAWINSVYIMLVVVIDAYDVG